MEDPTKSFCTILVSPLSYRRPLVPKLITRPSTKQKTREAGREVDRKKGPIGNSREDPTWRTFEPKKAEAEKKAKDKGRGDTSNPESVAIDSPEDVDGDVILVEVVAPKPDPPKKLAAKRPGPTKKSTVLRGRRGASSEVKTGPAEVK
jgi:hypothetical protein